MKPLHQILAAVCAGCVVLSGPGVARADWTVSTDTDPFSDQKIISATVAYPDGATTKAAMVRCSGKKFEVFVSFGEFMGDQLASARYRIDKRDVHEEKWSPSANGTSLFTHDPAGIARDFLTGTQFVVEAQDFRGQPHRVTFDISRGALLVSILQQCGLSPIGMEQQVPGLSREIARELEIWGPQSLSLTKNILHALGYYEGPVDSAVEPDFAAAVQKFYDEAIVDCKKPAITVEPMPTKPETRSTKPPVSAARIAANYCNDVREGHSPAVHSVIFELAPEPFQSEFGKLYGRRD